VATIANRGFRSHYARGLDFPGKRKGPVFTKDNVPWVTTAVQAARFLQVTATGARSWLLPAP